MLINVDKMLAICGTAFFGKSGTVFCENTVCRIAESVAGQLI